MVSKAKIAAHAKHLICLECGGEYQVLKGHLAKAHGLTPDAYRTKWGLAKSYPMTAPGFSRERSRLAKELGIGSWPTRPNKDKPKDE